MHRGQAVLEVKDLSRAGQVLPHQLHALREGDPGHLWPAGLGRTELLETIFGLAPSWSGTIRAFGRPVVNRSPREAISNGFAMIPENRRDAGIFPVMNVTENINTANPAEMSGIFGVLRAQDHEERVAESFIRSFSIKTSSRSKKLRDLSGGNQQKVVISKWLAAHPRILLIDELTRGIDVGRKGGDLQRSCKSLRDEGLSILMVSSELAEIIAESDGSSS